MTILTFDLFNEHERMFFSPLDVGGAFSKRTKPQPVAVNAGKRARAAPYCTHKPSSGKRAPFFMCGVEINRIRDLGDLGGIIRLCIGERQQRW